MKIQPIKAVFQGEHGAFSEDAARRAFGNEVVTLPRRSFEEIFEAVIGGAADVAVVPIENTLAGSVIKNYDLLVEHDLTIMGEVVLRVMHNLIAAPGVRLEQIKRVYSHPVALAQCTRFLAKVAHIEVVPAYDTAGAVKMIMDCGRRDEAAIAGRSAADVYGAQVLAAGIESNDQNFTRFFLLARPDRTADIPLLGNSGIRKTSIVFRVGNKPGALYKSLAAFADEAIDLTKIESRPIEGRPWEYSFYLDFLGDGTDAPVARALTRLTTLAESVRILGSYPKAET